MTVKVPPHLLSPHSRVLGFAGPGKAFYAFPHNDQFPDGWGKPYEDPAGNPIEPGTPGGPDPFRKVYTRDDGASWKVKKLPGSWLYGNIDWRGPTDPDQPDPDIKIKLSYHGPQTRYFPDGKFIYGAESEHNEIYIKGQYADVAPLPVLGAAYFQYTDPNTFVTADYIAVVCRDKLEDVLFIREKKDPIIPEDMTPALRAERMERYNFFTAKDGWREALRVIRQVVNLEQAVAPDTPWFFSEDGMECQCMRRFTKKYDNGVKEVTETGASRYKILIQTPTQATFLNQRNTSGYNVRAYADKESYPHMQANFRFITWNDKEQLDPDCAICYFPDRYTYPTIDPEDWHMEHFFAVDYIEMGQTIDGQYIVGVDYYENEEILIKCEYDIEHIIRKYWRYCIDHKVAATLGNPGNLRPWTESAPDSPNQWDFTRTHYWDEPLDGWRFEDWAWYDLNNDPTTTLQCEACTYYSDPGEDLTKIIQDYLDAGNPVPPDALFNNQYQLPSYDLNGTISLKWTHPFDAKEHVLYPYIVQTGTRSLNLGAASTGKDVLSDRVYFQAQIQHLDVRIPEGPFVVFRSESIQRSKMGAAKQYHPAYDVGITREGYVNADGTVHDVPWDTEAGAWTGDSGSYASNTPPWTVWDSKNYYNHEWYTFASRADIKEEVRYEYVDPFDDPTKVQLVALEEGTGYEYWNEIETLSREDMTAWNPANATASPYEPQSVDSGTDGGGTWNHDWRRNDFNWSYDIISVEGAFISEQDLTDENYEPHVNDAVKGAYGQLNWPNIWAMLGEGGQDIIGGFAWLEKTAVCLSFEYKKGTSPKPVTAPTADALKSTEYVNYLTDADLDALIAPGDRCYPIGVE